MSFAALYADRCGECDGSIEVGQLIEPTGRNVFETRRHGHRQQYRHAVCPEVVELAPIKASETRCSRCWAHHPGEC